MGYRLLCTLTNRKPQTTRRQSKNRAWLLLALVSAVGNFAGCSAVSGVKNNWNYNGGWNQMMMGYRNEAWANKAWHNRKHQFCREKHLHEFCEGFRAGYAATSDGSEGCSPAFPPRQYWSWQYQSAEGQAKVAAWYAGFPHGARAADEDGIGNWNQIQTSTNVQKNLQAEGMLGPGQSPGMYPMPEAQPLAAVNAAKYKAEQAAASQVYDNTVSEVPFTSGRTLSNPGDLLRK